MSFPLPVLSHERLGTTEVSPLSKRRRFVHNSSPAPSSLRESGGAGPGPSSSVLVHRYGLEPLRSDVQTQLFQVGMRIRKSVKDGYQTTSKNHRTHADVMAEIATDPIPLGGTRSTFTTPVRSWQNTSNNKRTFRRDDDEESDIEDSWPATPRFPGSDHKVTIPSEFFSINYDFDSTSNEPNLLTPERSPSSKGVLKARINSRKMAVPRTRRLQTKPEFRHRVLFSDFDDLDQEARDQQPESGQDIFMSSQDTPWIGVESLHSRKQRLLSDFEEANFLRKKEDVEMDWM